MDNDRVDDVTYDSDSDFYGQIDAVERLRERVRLADDVPVSDVPVVKQESRTPSIKEEEEEEEEEEHDEKDEKPLLNQAQPRPELFNPFAGVSYAWQLGESVDDFVARLPPATTWKDAHTPWIYVCNPFAGRRKTRTTAQSQLIAGCEDEGPEDDKAQTVLFVEGGKERLALLAGFLDGMAQMGLPRGAAAKEAAAAQRSAGHDILTLAGHLGVTCGKWMLFVRPGHVNAVWHTVARATVRGELGIAAKVAPRDPAVAADRQAEWERLICVYTADFRDRNDVGRVLRRLQALGLVRKQKNGRIFYKCDAYTYLGIGAKNPWGLRASLFSSGDTFASAEDDDDDATRMQVDTM
ncbi:delta-9 acyl-CoA desaturase [Niveomyces insectorum RCEF 264]|uniref:Delta-9 acyl-CoA desaturase n=1 Tax=Niveomyces insectorum RCEF 264 TaxID=1081102 RepID=A0A167MKZ8_9HYPO|nr:delta-9 acyl-CoA desaturase [Niveomyces insectorum RCEF 264]